MDLAQVVSLVGSTAAAGLSLFVKHAISALERRHESELRRMEESHKTELARQMEDFKKTLSFLGAADTELRAWRVKSYAELWQITRVLPRWPVDPSASYDSLKSLSEKLRHWYFGTGTDVPGGMLLTPDAVAAYRALQDAITESIQGKELSMPLDAGDYQAIRLLCSRLRDRLSQDIISRRETPGSLD